MRSRLQFTICKNCDLPCSFIKPEYVCDPQISGPAPSVELDVLPRLRRIIRYRLILGVGLVLYREKDVDL